MTPFDCGYGKEHNWNNARYDITIPRNLCIGFSAATEYENQSNHDTALEQLHVQDSSKFIALINVCQDWISQHKEVLNRSIEKVFSQFKVTIFCPGFNEGAGAADRDFDTVIFESHNDAHATSERPKDLNTIAILADPGIKNEKKRVAAVFLLRPDAPVWPASAQHNAALKPVLNDILIGNGVKFTPRHDNMDSARPVGQLLTFNIFDTGVDSRVVELCRSKLDEEDRRPFSQYFSHLPIGVAVISAPGGSGKSRLSSIIATLFAHSPKVQKVIVSAPSNGACSNIEERITNMTSQFTSELAEGGYQSRNLMCLRGYAIDREAQKSLDILRGDGYIEDDELNPCPWKFRHSLSWWTLLALDAPMRPTSRPKRDNQELCDLDARLNALLDVLDPTAEEESDEEDDAESKGAPKATPFESFTDLVENARRVITIQDYTEQQASLKRKVTLRKDIAIILDEAAAMHRTDGLIVYGNTPRSMIIVGDEKQLAPTLMTANQKDEEGIDVNRFADDTRISFLSWWLHLGFPAFHLYKQHRMARGMFDLSLELVYRNLKGEFKYAESCALTNFTYASDIRAYLQHTSNLIMPADTMAPVFMNCNNCPSRVDPVSKSRYNARAVECMVRWLKAFICKLSIPTDRIAAITPYRANLQHIRSQLSTEPTLEGIEVITIDSFHGCAADIILLCLAVGKQSGPWFTAHPQRLNVTVTRHKTALFVFGDIDTIPATDPDRPKRPRSKDETAEDGAPVKVNATMMTKMFQRFRYNNDLRAQLTYQGPGCNYNKEQIRDNNMIIHLQGDPTVDPDV
ncbi:AAA-12 domain-containing protein [Fusarium sp. LHS14.1]|nr:AAA-12 domain-containing protein [Fusarium sp. LHS14.1]